MPGFSDFIYQIGQFFIKNPIAKTQIQEAYRKNDDIKLDDIKKYFNDDMLYEFLNDDTYIKAGAKQSGCNEEEFLKKMLDSIIKHVTKTEKSESKDEKLGKRLHPNSKMITHAQHLSRLNQLQMQRLNKQNRGSHLTWRDEQDPNEAKLTQRRLVYLDTINASTQYFLHSNQIDQSRRWQDFANNPAIRDLCLSPLGVSVPLSNLIVYRKKGWPDYSIIELAKFLMRPSIYRPIMNRQMTIGRAVNLFTTASQMSDAAYFELLDLRDFALSIGRASISDANLKQLQDTFKSSDTVKHYLRGTITWEKFFKSKEFPIKKDKLYEDELHEFALNLYYQKINNASWFYVVLGCIVRVNDLAIGHGLLQPLKNASEITCIVAKKFIAQKDKIVITIAELNKSVFCFSDEYAAMIAYQPDRINQLIDAAFPQPNKTAHLSKSEAKDSKQAPDFLTDFGSFLSTMVTRLEKEFTSKNCPKSWITANSAYKLNFETILNQYRYNYDFAKEYVMRLMMPECLKLLARDHKYAAEIIQKAALRFTLKEFQNALVMMKPVGSKRKIQDNSSSSVPKEQRLKSSKMQK